MMLYRGLLLVATLVLGACGGGDSSGGGGTTTGGTSGGGTGGGTTGGGVIPGGGGFDLDTGIGGSGGIIGDIDEFGSIVMNGLTLDTDDAEFYVEGESGFSQDDLREGQYIIVAGDVSAAIAEEVVYRANLKGPVSAVPLEIDPLAGLYELTVLNQTVLTSPSTRFDGILVENIIEGDLLEVSGPIDAQGRVLATYIELESALSEYKAVGTVAALDSGVMTFDLAGLLVDYSSATLSEFEGEALANGQLVEVKMTTTSFPVAGAVAVTEVELLPVAQLSEDAEMEVEGVIDSFTAIDDFTVNGLPVTTDGNTVYENGTSGQLAANVRIEVEGLVNAMGVIVAEEIEFEDDPAIRVEGAVTAVDVTAASVTAMGLTFEIRASTELEDDRDSVEPFTLDDLMLGDYIEIRGYLSDGSIVAVELERDDSPSPEFRTLLRGPLTAFDESAGTLEIQGVTVNELAGTTEYEDEENPVSRTEFFNLLPTALSAGAEVTADWDDFSPSNAAPSDAGPANNLSLEEDD